MKLVIEIELHNGKHDYPGPELEKELKRIAGLVANWDMVDLQESGFAIDDCIGKPISKVWLDGNLYKNGWRY